MTPTEQGHSSLSVTSPIIKSPDVDDRLSTNYSDVYGHYSAPTTHMMMNKSYSPVPGVQDNSALYSSPHYNQYGPSTPHPPTMLPSPQFINSTLGSPSPSVTSAYSSQPHYTSASPHYTLNASQQAAAATVAAVAPPSSQSPSSSTLRTVYLGNIASDTDMSDILDQVRSGPIEMARPFPEKNCVFLTFVDASAAAHFYYQVSNRAFSINGVELKVGWGKPSAMPATIRVAVQNGGASRNVFLGSLDESVNEDVIREDLKRFGTIEHVRLIREKNIAFVHFLSIANAIKCVNSLPCEGEWQNRRVYYGKDRCSQQQQQQQHIIHHHHHGSSSSLPSNPATYASLPPHYHHQPMHVQHAYPVRYSPSITYDPYTGTTVETYTTPSPSSIAHPRPPPQQPGISTQPAPPTATPHQLDQHHHSHPPPPTTMVPALSDMYHPHPPLGPNVGHSLAGVANRTIYLGNIHPDTTCEEICNVVRGGMLSQIRYMADKHIAFIAFVDPVLALHFYTQASYHGIVIKSRRLKLGWGKPSSLPGNVLQAVQNGGSRNVYIGNMDDSTTEEKLLQDFSEYGDIELVNTLKEKNCAFVNFTSIAAAIRAIDGIRSKEEYKRFRINYGKDRCGNPPRSLLQHQQQQQLPPPTNGITTPPPTTATTDQDSLVATTDRVDPVAAFATTTPTTATNAFADLMTPTSTLRLPPSGVDEQTSGNGVLNTVIHH